MKRNTRPSGSSDEERLSLKKAKKENGKENLDSDSSETDDDSNEAYNRDKSAQENEIDENKDDTNGIGKNSFSCELKGRELNTETSILNFDIGIDIKRDELISCTKNAYNPHLENDEIVRVGSSNCRSCEDKKEGSNRSPTNSGISQEILYSRDEISYEQTIRGRFRCLQKIEKDRRSRINIGESSHSTEHPPFDEVHPVRSDVERDEIVISDASVTGIEDCDRGVSHEFYYSSECYVASDLNVGKYEDVEGEIVVERSGSDSHSNSSERVGSDSHSVSRERVGSDSHSDSSERVGSDSHSDSSNLSDAFDALWRSIQPYFHSDSRERVGSDSRRERVGSDSHSDSSDSNEIIGRGSNSSDDSDQPRESHSSNVGVPNGVAVANGESEERINNDNVPDADEREENANEANEEYYSDESELFLSTDYSEDSGDEGYITAANVYLSDADRARRD